MTRARGESSREGVQFAQFLMPLGDILESAQHTNHRTLGIQQRYLGRFQPVLHAMCIDQRSFHLDPRAPTVTHHRAIIGAIEFGIRRPRQVFVQQARNGCGGGESCVVRVGAVTAEIAALGIFPEHAHRNGIQHQAQEALGGAQRLFGRLETTQIDIHV